MTWTTAEMKISGGKKTSLWNQLIYRQTTGKCTLLHMANWNNLSMSDLLRGNIPHVFCLFPDVCTFHTKFYCTTSGHVGSTRWPQTPQQMRASQEREVTCKDLCKSSAEGMVNFQHLCNSQTQRSGVKEGGLYILKEPSAGVQDSATWMRKKVMSRRKIILSLLIFLINIFNQTVEKKQFILNNLTHPGLKSFRHVQKIFRHF